MANHKDKLPVDLKSLARAHTKSCIQQLAGIASNGESESARVAAISILLDRGWGKAEQPHGSIDGDIRITIRQIVGDLDGKTIEHRASEKISKDDK